MLLSGSTGIEVLVLCQTCGFVIPTGVIGLDHLMHDCVVCVGLVEQFGTCEYMHQANPGACTCRYTRPRVKTSVQTVLETQSTVRTRVRYWMNWSRTEGRRLGLTVEPSTAPNLLNTDDEGSSKISPKDTQPGVMSLDPHFRWVEESRGVASPTRGSSRSGRYSKSGGRKNK